MNLFPNSKIVRAEADIIDALTLRLPSLGVTILPVQFKQVKDPMEIVKLAITSQSGAYLHVNELIEIAKLLGLRSEEEISVIEEAIAREAAVSGDLQLAFDLCLILAKKGHGPVWDLCAAIARGPALDHMDMNSRKQLLGFALSHCDEESIGELLNAWKDLDMQDQCDLLKFSVATSPADYSHVALSVQFDEQSEMIESHSNDISSSKSILRTIAESIPVDYSNSWESFLEENSKLLSFTKLQLPWLLELIANEQRVKPSDLGILHGKHFTSTRTRALLIIVSWLSRNNLAPKDSLLESLARSILETPVCHEDDILGCSVLLNLLDAFSGVQVIEEQLKIRQEYQDISSIMNVGMTYSLLHSNGVECKDPVERRELAKRLFKEKPTTFTSGSLLMYTDAHARVSLSCFSCLCCFLLIFRTVHKFICSFTQFLLTVFLLLLNRCYFRTHSLRRMSVAHMLHFVECILYGLGITYFRLSWNIQCGSLIDVLYNRLTACICCVPEEINRIATVDSKFWREWKLKLDEQKRMADHSRLLEQVLPGVDISRCLSGDVSYIEEAVFSLIESIQLEKKHILKKLMLLAQTYSLNHSKVNKDVYYSFCTNKLHNFPYANCITTGSLVFIGATEFSAFCPCFRCMDQ